MDFVPAHKQIN